MFCRYNIYEQVRALQRPNLFCLGHSRLKAPLFPKMNRGCFIRDEAAPEQELIL